MPDEPFNHAHSPNPEPPSATPLPVTETQQPDPFLQTSTGRMGAGGITVVAVAVAIILGVVLYGLNDRTTAETTAAAPSTANGQQAPAGGKSSAATPGAPRANESGVKG